MTKQQYFTEKLNYYMNKKGVTPVVLATSLSCLPSLVELWAKGERLPEDETVEKIAVFFNVGKDELLLKAAPNNGQESKRKITKRQVLGNCVRCGKPIYQGDIFGKGSTERVIRSEMFKNPVEETVFIYEKGGSGYEYFCENCCDYLLLQNKLEEQRDSRNRLAFLQKIMRRSTAIGVIGFAIMFAVSLLFVFNLFNVFPWDLGRPYKLGSILISFVFGYFVFSLVYVAFSGKTWVYKCLSKTTNVLFAYLVGHAVTSKNDVLLIGVVRAIIVVIAACFSTVLFAPTCLLMGMFSMIIWPKARMDVDKEINVLREELYK